MYLYVCMDVGTYVVFICMYAYEVYSCMCVGLC